MTSGDSRGFVIRKATMADLDAIKGIADAHRHELGFVLRPALAESIDRDEVSVAEVRQRVIGFAEYHHRRDVQTTLYHIAVAPEHRGRGVGRALMNALRSEAASLGKQRILAKCPADLPARGFYERLGFELTATESGKVRLLLILVWPLPPAEFLQAILKYHGIQNVILPPGSRNTVASYGTMIITPSPNS